MPTDAEERARLERAVVAETRAVQALERALGERRSPQGARARLADHHARLDALYAQLADAWLDEERAPGGLAE